MLMFYNVNNLGYGSTIIHNNSITIVYYNNITEILCFTPKTYIGL